MIKIIIDGEKIKNEAELHDFLASELSFPEYYGRNLDALFDMLCDISFSVQIEIVNFEALTTLLGEKTDGLIAVFSDAAIENKNIRFSY